MGNTCSAKYDTRVASPVTAPICQDHNFGDPMSFIDDVPTDIILEKQSLLILNSKVNFNTAPSKYAPPRTSTEGLINSSFPPGFPSPKFDSSQLLHSSVVRLLSQKAAYSSLEIPKGTATLRTDAENGREKEAYERASENPVAKLQLYVVTWNMNGRLLEPEKNLSLLLDLHGEKHDLYVIGLQEAPNFSGEETIGNLLGDEYCCVGLSLMMSLQLYIFAKKSLRSHITGTMADKLVVGGLGYVVGRQKGAVAVLLAYNKVSLLFITSHLAPHERNLVQRNHQYERICKSVFTRSNGLCSNCKNLQSIRNELELHCTGGQVGNFVEETDIVVWLGDLNYRVEMPQSSVRFLISHNLGEVLWTRDQLQRAIQRGEIFKGFLEGPLLFPPTFKFDVGSDNYDTSTKERTPSWTDRILYKVKPTSPVKVDLMVYNSISAVKTSDHKPVKAYINLKNLLRKNSYAF